VHHFYELEIVNGADDFNPLIQILLMVSWPAQMNLLNIHIGTGKLSTFIWILTPIMVISAIVTLYPKIKNIIKDGEEKGYSIG